MLLALVVAPIRWIGRLSKLEAVTEVIELAEEAARSALDDLARNPFLAGVGLAQAPTSGFPLTPESFGYVRTVDAAALGELSQDLGTDLYLLARPLLISGRPLGQRDLGYGGGAAKLEAAEAAANLLGQRAPPLHGHALRLYPRCARLPVPWLASYGLCEHRQDFRCFRSDRMVGPAVTAGRHAPIRAGPCGITSTG